jgi:predicted Fe-Mo cluster-binding NifX family protein
MRVGIPVWNERISPVLDEAGRLLVVEVEGERELGRHLELLHDGDPVHRTERLKQLGVDLLLCGALTRPLREVLTANGVPFVPWLCGCVDEVLDAFEHGRLDARFLMPGCVCEENLHALRDLRTFTDSDSEPCTSRDPPVPAGRAGAARPIPFPASRDPRRSRQKTTDRREKT